MTTKKDNNGGYAGVALLVGAVTFLWIWAYSFSEWGLLIGLLIGWLPALIGAFVVGLLWPLFLVGVLIFIAIIFLS